MLTSFGGGLSVEVLSIRNKSKISGESNFPLERARFEPAWEREVKIVPLIVVVAERRMFPTLRHIPTWDSWVRETGKGGLIKDG